MKCPFKTLAKYEMKITNTEYVVVDAERKVIAKCNYEDDALYIQEVINSHAKIQNEIQVIINRLERNRNAERLNSESTKEPSKSFWRGQAEKASEVMIWLQQALKEAEQE
jgi:hypothetical protein